MGTARPWLVAPIAASALLVLLASASSLAQPCGDDVCPEGPDAGPEDPPGPGDCWSDDVGVDLCYPDPPEPCEPTEPAFTFIDNLDENNADNQIVALNSESSQGCGTLRVDTTGYYRLFDIELAESGPSQLDETGYITVTNSCNTEGWASERNYGDRYLVVDSDNDACTGPADMSCGSGRYCGPSGGCIPDEPTFLGTFLLVSGEDNIICINHWCPDYDDEVALGNDPGFVFNQCDDPGAINSIHFRITDDTLACEDDTTVQPCRFGCFDGECPEDPCDAADCPLYCKDGVCLDANPCADLECAYGCKNGYCLQPPGSRGEDGDNDGFTELGDCDDTSAEVYPGAEERCGNRIDDDCDGAIDEGQCQSSSSGCGCSTLAKASDWTYFVGVLLLALGLFLRLRRRRADSI